MGWASGSYMAEKLWDDIRKYIPSKDHKKVAKKIFDLFASEDADDWNPGSKLCRDAGMYQDEDGNEA